VVKPSSGRHRHEWEDRWGNLRRGRCVRNWWWSQGRVSPAAEGHGARCGLHHPTPFPNPVAPLSISARILPHVEVGGLAQVPAAQAPLGFSFSPVRLLSAALCYLSPSLGRVPQRRSRPYAPGTSARHHPPSQCSSSGGVVFSSCPIASINRRQIASPALSPASASSSARIALSMSASSP